MSFDGGGWRPTPAMLQNADRVKDMLEDVLPRLRSNWVRRAPTTEEQYIAEQRELDRLLAVLEG